jgi:hypothetical protein
MPLLYKPRDPNAWIKKPKRRKPKTRVRLQTTVLPETKAYFESKRETIVAGRLVDEAIKLYRELEHESQTQPAKKRGEPLGNQYARVTVKRQPFNTTVSIETKAYLESMRDEITPGELIDIAIKLYREVNNE